MKKYKFHPTELSEKAFKVYSTSDFTFYKDGDQWYGSDSPKENPTMKFKDIADIEEFLEEFSDEE